MTIMNVEVKTAAKVEGNRGPQWELQVKYPFSAYPTKAWIDRSPDQAEPTAGTYVCDVLRGDLKDGKDEEAARDYDYRWRIVGFDVEGDPEYQPKPPADEAKAQTATRNRPEPTYEQQQANAQALKNRSIERQVALKAAIKLYGTQGSNLSPSGTTPGNWGSIDVLATANEFFAWLREAPSDAPSEAAEPVSEPQGTEQPNRSQCNLCGETWTTGVHACTPTESDGGPPLFPPEQAAVASEGPRHFADVGAFRKALKDNFGLAATAQVNKALDEAGLGPLAEVRNLDEAYATIAAHRGQPTKNEEGA